MRKSRSSSSRHRLVNRTSQIFDGDPDLTELDDTSASTDASVLVASQLGMPTPRRDQKSLCNVLFSGKKGKQTKPSVQDHSPVQQTDSSVISNVVSTSVCISDMIVSG